MHRRDHALHRLALALQMRLDRAIGEVSHPARKPDAPRGLDRPVATEHPLDRRCRLIPRQNVRGCVTLWYVLVCQRLRFLNQSLLNTLQQSMRMEIRARKISR